MIDRYVCVSCDRCGQPAGGVEDLTASVAAARRFAVRAGFVRRVGAEGKSEDLCPSCAKQVAE